jgi:hypothetical protein
MKDERFKQIFIHSFIHLFHIQKSKSGNPAFGYGTSQNITAKHNTSNRSHKIQYMQYRSQKYNTEQSHTQNTIPKRTIECITLENTKHV